MDVCKYTAVRELFDAHLPKYWHGKRADAYSVFDTPDGEMLLSLFRRPVPDDQRYYDRLAKEFSLIISNDFIKVFLQVRRILDIIGDTIPHIIRGSAGSCLCCYLICITDIDPIKENISLARFMHERRQDYPDIDMDFPWNQRDLILKRIHDEWGDRVARISNHIMYQPKSAIRQAVRDFGYRKFLSRDFDLSDIFPDPEERERVEKRASEYIGKLRCHSLHCGGIVIFEEDVPEDLRLKEYEILKRVPGRQEPEDRLPDTDRPKGIQIKLNKDETEDAGYIKIDILSNRGLGELWDIEQRHIADYDFEDPATYAVFASGDTIGITYSESRAMRKILMVMRPTSLDHISEALALVRPSASQRYQKSDYLRKYHLIVGDKGRREDYIIYDDDAIQYIQRMLGCNESIADVYRKAYAKNKPELKREFLGHLKRRRPDLSWEQRVLIGDQLDRLNSYSFCKSHAYSYAKLVWALAYQKAHNPRRFWLAALNNCNSSYRKWVHYREARTAGLQIQYGRGPWQFHNDDDGDVLVPVQVTGANGKKRRPCNKPTEGLCAEDGFQTWGYWTDRDFLPGMYYYTKKMTRMQFYRHIGRGLNRSKKNLEEELTVGFFRGLVACGRPHKTDKITETGRLLKRMGKTITFATLGYDNGKYIDVVLWGTYKTWSIHIIEGIGLLRSDPEIPQDIAPTWLEVAKFSFDWVRPKICPQIALKTSGTSETSGTSGTSGTSNNKKKGQRNRILVTKPRQKALSSSRALSSLRSSGSGSSSSFDWTGFMSGQDRLP